jgi:hypothetical protein
LEFRKIQAFDSTDSLQAPYKTMTDHVYQQFPDHIEAIQSILKTDEAFGGICADYEEICTWLTAQQRRAGESCEECERALELRLELEQEIISALKQKGSIA